MDVQEPERKKRNTNYCCVPQCSNYIGDGRGSHLFPRIVELKKKWELALKMGKPASTAMRVCASHFVPENYFPSSKQRAKLFPNVVPSKNLPKRLHDRPESPSGKEAKDARSKRAKLRCDRKTSNQDSSKETETPEVANNEDLPSDSAVLLPSILSVYVQVNLADNRKIRPNDTRGMADILIETCGLGPPHEKCTQVNFLPEENSDSASPSYTLPDRLTNNVNLFTFTGIHSLDLLDALVSCVTEIALDAATNKRLLSVRDRIILTMVKIKENMTFAALGVLFGVSAQTCSNYFKNMCPILAIVLKVVIPFRDQEMIRCNLPNSFKHLKNTRIILDCAETPVEKCKCLKCRVLTYSQYKKDYTMKFNLGITPSGLITEISAPYYGRASDKLIVNDSGILDKLDYQDGVMVDKGYRIEKECAQRNLHLIRPPFLKNKKQMTKKDDIKNAEIARARVHIERVIQRMRQYEFLRGPIPWALAPYIEDVLTIIAGLTNLGPPIMNIDKFM